MTQIETKSHFVRSAGENSLHLMEFTPLKESAKPILLVHGAIENGSIFYSKSAKGLAPFLQKSGFHCFVLDLRGRGLSAPPVNKDSNFNQGDIIAQDFPAVFNYLHELLGSNKLNLISHSWGGVLLNSFLLEFPDYRKTISKVVHLATKRRVAVLNFHRLFYIDFAWLFLGSIILKVKGFLPKGYFGPDGESAGTLRDSQKWVYSKKWEDSRRGVDYAELASSSQLPPTLYITGSHDKALGHPSDVRRFALESGHTLKDVKVVGRKFGYSINYDHISLLTHKSCPDEHFLEVARFLDT